jgi:hypothetical protein
MDPTKSARTIFMGLSVHAIPPFGKLCVRVMYEQQETNLLEIRIIAIFITMNTNTELWQKHGIFYSRQQASVYETELT